MLTVRLTQNQEEALNTYCETEGRAKSQVVKEALVAYLSKNKNDSAPYEAGKDLFGQAHSSEIDKSVTFKAKLKKRLSEKHTH